MEVGESIYRNMVLLLTLAHAQEGYCSWSVSVFVCVCVWHCVLAVSVPDFSLTANTFATKLAMKDKTHGPDAMSSCSMNFFCGACVDGKRAYLPIQTDFVRFAYT